MKIRFIIAPYLLALCLLTPSACIASPTTIIGVNDVDTVASLTQSMPWEKASSSVIDVTNQSFTKATRVTVTSVPANFWDAQIVAQSERPVRGGDQLTLTYWARSVGAPGQLMAKVQWKSGEAKDSGQVSLATDWKQHTLTTTAPADAATGEFTVRFFFGQMQQIVEVGGIRVMDADAAAVSTATAQGLDPYNAGLVKEFAQTYHAVVSPVFGATEDLANAGFHIIGPAADGAKQSVVDITGQSFHKAVSVVVSKTSGEDWHIMGQLINPSPIRAGNSYVLTFYGRGSVPGISGSEANSPLAIKRRSDGSVLASLRLTLSESWHRYFLTFVADKDAAPGDVEVIFVLGNQVQNIDLGGISVLDAGKAPISGLPGVRTAHMDYDGRDPDVAWRKQALVRIDKIRKADMKVVATDSNGKPLQDAAIHVAMLRSAFGWGNFTGSVVQFFSGS